MCHVQGLHAYACLALVGFGWHKAGSFVVFKITVSSHTDVVGKATEILQSVPIVVVLDDILYSSVAVLIATTLRLWLMASSSL